MSDTPTNLFSCFKVWDGKSIQEIVTQTAREWLNSHFTEDQLFDLIPQDLDTKITAQTLLDLLKKNTGLDIEDITSQVTNSINVDSIYESANSMLDTVDGYVAGVSGAMRSTPRASERLSRASWTRLT